MGSLPIVHYPERLDPLIVSRVMSHRGQESKWYFSVGKGEIFLNFKFHYYLKRKTK